ncbi:MAG: Gamma-glutamyl phosphate reductase (EC [uncultured Sulfurovum sp.]|uniref:Gamma-glutamyl phosphate reductase n=1 Tax=uncultured Sulfurovum sp. TaxID=269237 RepID=A0A6S6TE21_9BACT|nr:MAG: Gamma-glutamyl phosphate reductase (EC [uncultured Sulfurovum sp.]
MIQNFLQKAKDTEKYISLLSDDEKNKILLEMATAILDNSNIILEANKIDMDLAYKNNLNDVGLDRLMLNQRRIENMAKVMRRMTSYPNPVGNLLEEWTSEEELQVKRISVPLGVVSIIYELRPSMTSDGAALCFKTGNVCVLKGADDTENSNHAIIKILQEVLENNNLPKEIISFLFDGSKEGIVKLVKEDKYIDAVLTRGGAIFNRYIELNSLVPVIAFDRGLNHIYIDKEAHFRKALEVSRNSKCLIPNVCNATETLLIHENIASDLLPKLHKIFKAEGTVLKGCPQSQKIITINEAKEEDFNIEYLANILNIKIVKDVEEALTHIDQHGSGHSEAIITENSKTAELFMDRADATCLYLNASTKFSDGSTFHSGSEVGIATNKLHVRGPLRIDALTTYKYKIYGEGTTKLTWNGYFTPFSFFGTLTIGLLFVPTRISLIMLLAGYFAYQHESNLVFVILPSIFIFTALGLFSKFKIEKSNNKILKYFSKAFYVHPKQLMKLENKFEKYPRISDYLVSKLKGLKQFISLPSALTKLPKKAFIIFTTLHSIFWTTLLSMIGYGLGYINAF